MVCVICVVYGVFDTCCLPVKYLWCVFYMCVVCVMHVVCVGVCGMIVVLVVCNCVFCVVSV